MTGDLNFLLIGFLLQGALCGQFDVFMPHSIEALSGSCVTIPCSFDVADDYNSGLDNTYDPPTLTLTPSTLKVEEGTSVSVTSEEDIYVNTSMMRKSDKLETQLGHQHVANKSSEKQNEEGSDMLYASVVWKSKKKRKKKGDHSGSLYVEEESIANRKKAEACKTGGGPPPPPLTEAEEMPSVRTVGDLLLSSSEPATPQDTRAYIRGVLCGRFEVIIPQTIEVLSGSCVTIPCSFDVEDKYNSRLDETYDPPTPTLTPSTLKVEEGTSVSLKCSAPAPCLSHPPTLTWSSSLGHIQESLQENQDRTKVKTSVLTFTASRLHHRLEISCPLCGQYDTFMPQTIEVLSGSCVTIPCFFDVEEKYKSNVDETCRALWENDQGTVVFDSSNPQTTGHLTGNLKNRDCTTTLNNMRPENSNKYFFRLDCNGVKYDFKQRKLDISVTDVPPTPTLTPSTLKVEEGTSVSLKCSAPAPCLSHPPALTWSSSLGHIQESLQENQDRTKVKTSVLTFTASHLHHRLEISCTAVYNKQDGSSQSVSTSLTADISYPPKITTVSVSPSGPVPENSSVTLTCSSSANPAVRSYTWYRADGGQEVIGTGNVLNIAASEVIGPFFCKTENDHGAGRSNTTQIDVQYSPKHTTLSVSPSGPVPEDSIVTLTCSSVANPAVKTYSWYRPDGGQETLIGTGRVLNITASKVSGPFFCKAENLLGAGRSNIGEIDVQYSPQNTTLSVSPSGPVTEDTGVTLTCSSAANPAVEKYTWYRAGGGQETVMGTGHVLNIKASRDSGPFFCEAENAIGAGRSNISLIDVQFAPQILSSYDCSQTTDQLNCSCETVGNPSPALQWYLDGLPVNHSDRFAISSEPLNISGLRSIITVSQPQRRDLSTLLCHSSNSLGSTTQRFFVYSLEPHDRVTLPVFITIVVVLVLLICGLLLFIRAQRTHQIVHKSTVAMSQALTSGEANEVPNAEEDATYINAKEARQADVTDPAAISEPNSTNLPSAGPNNAEGAAESSEKKKEEGSDVIYSTVNWKTKSKKKKEEDVVDMGQPGSSYLEEERCAVGAMSRHFVSDALEMGNLYDELEPRQVNKAAECEYAQVKFKRKSVMRK
ncbi:uncharacterized protein [Pagrus major]|uniref:uncharacterized protein n=1 Tax=Pagrus major TaxID=143350 RepID=UPI003CC8B149